jgi:V8-like Glu-specific endopeptidase
MSGSAEQYTVDDYENAIARISNSSGHAVGVGFLVTPGYVLTCAHVVLEALGIDPNEFENHPDQPTDLINLDFHVLASRQYIKAQVVAWESYSKFNGDIALLQLQSPAPADAKPMPLVEVERSQVGNDPHSVYGFGGGDQGGRSDAYRPKDKGDGGRFQLYRYKKDDQDETIQPGFSGSPVWNETRKRIIGMVATARIRRDESRSTAYAIPTQLLRPILAQVKALSLHDLLEAGLNQCDSRDQGQQLRRAITAVLQQCNPNGAGEPWAKQFVDLTDHPEPSGWESEGNLVQFAVLLARLDETPSPVYEQLKIWVENRGFDFAALLERATRQSRDQLANRPAVRTGCDHLIVTLDPDESGEASRDQYLLSIWPIADAASYQPTHPLQPLIQNESCPLAEIPQQVRSVVRDQLGKCEPIIHLFMPRALFAQGLEMLSSGRRSTLGSEYPCVLRTNPKTSPDASRRYYQDDWAEKWRQFQDSFSQAAADVFQPLDCQQPEDDLFDALEALPAAVLQNCEAIDELLDTVSEEFALPVALWSRDSQYEANLGDVLNCITQTLPRQVREARRTAWRARNSATLGHHLSLIWEDPKVMPPDVLFNPEAC